MSILDVAGVEKHFGGLPALGGVSFTVDEGEILALVGPNGAGKSTLLKAIGGMHAPTVGSIRFDGVELGGLKPHQARHHGVAIVLQTPQPFATMTVRENAALGALFGGVRMSERDALRRADEMLEFVELADRSDEAVSSLNLHEQRFLEIARQLAGGPRLILLDEVMAGLNDSELEHSVDLVQRARTEFGLTVIWVEHVMKAVMRLAERIIVLDFGRVIADGAPHDVMRQPDVVTAYLGEQRTAS
ncbi:MAG: ABC transporter ATP-binding protein [Ilumatobacteraceae bacterium]